MTYKHLFYSSIYSLLVIKKNLKNYPSPPPHSRVSFNINTSEQTSQTSFTARNVYNKKEEVCRLYKICYKSNWILQFVLNKHDKLRKTPVLLRPQLLQSCPPAPCFSPVLPPCMHLASPVLPPCTLLLLFCHPAPCLSPVLPPCTPCFSCPATLHPAFLLSCHSVLCFSPVLLWPLLVPSCHPAHCLSPVLGWLLLCAYHSAPVSSAGPQGSPAAPFTTRLTSNKTAQGRPFTGL